MADENDTDDGYTEAERELLERVAASRGEAFAEANAALILAQARLVGDL